MLHLVLITHLLSNRNHNIEFIHIVENVYASGSLEDYHFNSLRKIMFLPTVILYLGVGT